MSMHHVASALAYCFLLSSIPHRLDSTVAAFCGSLNEYEIYAGVLLVVFSFLTLVLCSVKCLAKA